jgi:hypothetical protein
MRGLRAADTFNLLAPTDFVCFEVVVCTESNGMMGSTLFH